MFYDMQDQLKTIFAVQANICNIMSPQCSFWYNSDLHYPFAGVVGLCWIFFFNFVTLCGEVFHVVK